MIFLASFVVQVVQAVLRSAHIGDVFSPRGR